MSEKPYEDAYTRMCEEWDGERHREWVEKLREAIVNRNPLVKPEEVAGGSGRRNGEAGGEERDLTILSLPDTLQMKGVTYGRQ